MNKQLVISQNISWIHNNKVMKVIYLSMSFLFAMTTIKIWMQFHKYFGPILYAGNLSFPNWAPCFADHLLGKYVNID